ncbi:MAG: winged helix-turn-helix transcriptional regulator [Hyphomonadaceae bacterium]|nr:winged helix-turn-helix transcriptional regulator [Hyphomonadaceae bacterium]
MATATSQQLDQLFFALSDPTRREIVRSLAKGEATVAQLSTPFPLAASKAVIGPSMEAAARSEPRTRKRTRTPLPIRRKSVFFTRTTASTSANTSRPPRPT